MFIFWCITIVYVERILHCTRHVEKNKIADLKVQITNVLMKLWEIVENIDDTCEYIDEFYEKYNVRRDEYVNADDDAISALFYDKQTKYYRYCNR